MIMKKLIIFLIFIIFTFISMPVRADIIPLSTKSVKYYGIGVLNMPSSYTVHQYPYKESKIIKEFDYESTKRSAIMNRVDMRKISYVAYVPSENIALLAVDLNPENDWYNVYVNQETGETGWVYNADKSAFLTYRQLFYKYGKKYGIRFFNDLTDEEKVLYSKVDITSKIVDKIDYPLFVTFTVIRGNWLLATVRDRSKQPKVGWFNWRNDDGTLNMFPNLKEQSRN